MFLWDFEPFILMISFDFLKFMGGVCCYIPIVIMMRNQDCKGCSPLSVFMCLRPCCLHGFFLFFVMKCGGPSDHWLKINSVWIKGF